MESGGEPADPHWCERLFRRAAADHTGLRLDIVEYNDEVRYVLTDALSRRHLIGVVIWRRDDLQLCVGAHHDLYDFDASRQECVDEVGQWMHAVLVDGYDERFGHRFGREYLLAIRLGEEKQVYRTRVTGLVFTIRRRRWRRVRSFAERGTMASMIDSQGEFESQLRAVVQSSGPVTNVNIVWPAIEPEPGSATAIVDLYYDLGDIEAFLSVAAWRGEPTRCRLQFTGDYEIDGIAIEDACAIVAAAAEGHVQQAPGSTEVDVVVAGTRHRLVKFGWSQTAWEVRAGLTGATG